MKIPPSLVNEQFDDRYFDVVNAMDEAQQIYFRNNRIAQRMDAGMQSGTPFLIGEMGFGAGRVVVALMEYLATSGIRGVDITYRSVELHPMSADRMAEILDTFRDRVGEGIDALVAAYRGMDIERPGWHSASIAQSFGTLTLDLWIGEALEMVERLETPCDAWFLDGHSPKKNPSIWRPELLTAIGEKTRTGGTCATFTVSVAVQKALAAAGFLVSKMPGCGGKKEVLQGTKIQQ